MLVSFTHACLQITALKNLNLNIRRAKLSQKEGSDVNTFFITEADTSEKIVKSARLEEIRMTVLNSLIATYPVSAVSTVIVVIPNECSIN